MQQLNEDDSVQDQRREFLNSNAVRVIDLFREWDDDNSGSVSRKEFHKARSTASGQRGVQVCLIANRTHHVPLPVPRGVQAMPMLGLNVPKEAIDELFSSWDPARHRSLQLDAPCPSLGPGPRPCRCGPAAASRWLALGQLA